MEMLWKLQFSLCRVVFHIKHPWRCQKIFLKKNNEVLVILIIEYFCVRFSVDWIYSFQKHSEIYILKVDLYIEECKSTSTCHNMIPSWLSHGLNMAYKTHFVISYICCLIDSSYQKNVAIPSCVLVIRCLGSSTTELFGWEIPEYLWCLHNFF